MLDNTHGLAVFTDGSAWTKDRSGGWAWVAIDDFDNEESASGHVADTTNNRMEMLAVVNGLNYCFEACGPSDVLVYSDSEYVVLGASRLYRKRIKNVDLWSQIDEAVFLHNVVEFNHVRGHANSHYNNLADKLAGAARKEGVGC